MRVEAIKVPEGLLIPMLNEFSRISENKIMLEIEIVNPHENDYSPLDGLIGLCEIGKANASVEHDRHIYLK